MSLETSAAPGAVEREPAARGSVDQPGFPFLEQLLLLLVLLAVFAAAWLALQRFFQMDEFVFARAAWLVKSGQLPYRDFFEHHTPLYYLALSPLFFVLPESFSALLGLRLANFSLLCILLVGIFRMSRRFAGRASALAATSLLLTAPGFVSRAIELRPDLLACTAFVWMLERLLAPDYRSMKSLIAAGLLAAAAILSNQKVLPLVGLTLLAWAISEFALHKYESFRRTMVPAATLFGCLAIFTLALAALGAAPSFWYQNATLALQWQKLDPGFPVSRYLIPTLATALTWTAAAGLGVLLVAIRIARGDNRRGNLLLMESMAIVLISLAALVIPWPYNFLPLFSVGTVFVARAFEGWFEAARRRRRLATIVTFALTAGATASYAKWYRAELGRSSSGQRTVVQRLLSLSSPDDAVLDSNGAYVFRPSAYFVWYHSNVIRRLLRNQMELEMVPSILRTGAPVFLRDDRFDELPAAVRRFVESHYLRVFGKIYLWGIEIRPPDVGAGAWVETSFLAVRDGDYFFNMPLGSDDAPGSLSVNGIEHGLREPFHLERGDHTVTIEFRDVDRHPIFLLWMPANHELWLPATEPGPPLYPFFF